MRTEQHEQLLTAAVAAWHALSNLYEAISANTSGRGQHDVLMICAIARALKPVGLIIGALEDKINREDLTEFLTHLDEDTRHCIMSDVVYGEPSEGGNVG